MNVEHLLDDLAAAALHEASEPRGCPVDFKAAFRRVFDVHFGGYLLETLRGERGNPSLVSAQRMAELLRIEAEMVQLKTDFLRRTIGIDIPSDASGVAVPDEADVAPVL